MNRFVLSSAARGAITFFAAAACVSAGMVFAQQPAAKKLTPDIERGRYLVRTSGCNDCHTPGYPESGGKMDEKLWLTGSTLGWRGPWGTTFPSNLRLVAQNLTEAQWLKHARTEWRPPMPWFSLRDMSDADLAAMYRYLRHLGPAGKPAPTFVPPGQEPKQPYVLFPAPPK
jgi:mono/diheme cytochrome c family protein